LIKAFDKKIVCACALLEKGGAIVTAIERGRGVLPRGEEGAGGETRQT